MKSKRQFKPVARQGGFNLIEVIGAIAIGAIVVVGVIYALGVGRDDANASNAGDQITLLQTNVRSMFSSPDYTSLGTSGKTGEQLLINAGKAPQPMISGSGATAKLQDSWGAEVTLFATNYASGTNNAFQITYDLLPKSVCNDILNSINPSFNLIVAGAHGGSGTSLKDDSAATPVVYSQAAAVTACNNTTNTIVLTST